MQLRSYIIGLELKLLIINEIKKEGFLFDYVIGAKTLVTKNSYFAYFGLYILKKVISRAKFSISSFISSTLQRLQLAWVSFCFPATVYYPR